jgi:hypothetical protein
MNETRINRNVVKKVSENGDIKYWKKIKYNMNYYYTKLSENICEQLGVEHTKSEKHREGKDMYLVTDDIKKDKDMYLGNEITRNNQLSKIKPDLEAFLESKRNY